MLVTQVNVSRKIASRDELSGRYDYHSTKNNSDIFVRYESIPELEGSEFYLIRRNGYWFITNEKYALDEKISIHDGLFRGFLRRTNLGVKNSGLLTFGNVYFQ